MRSTRTIIIRRTAGFLAGALLAAVLAGCSGSGSQGTEAQTTAAAETQETSAAFIYKTDSAENSMVTIRTVSGKQPEENIDSFYSQLD